MEENVRLSSQDCASCDKRVKLLALDCLPSHSRDGHPQTQRCARQRQHRSSSNNCPTATSSCLPAEGKEKKIHLRHLYKNVSKLRLFEASNSHSLSLALAPSLSLSLATWFSKRSDSSQWVGVFCCVSETCCWCCTDLEHSTRVANTQRCVFMQAQW